MTFVKYRNHDLFPSFSDLVDTFFNGDVPKTTYRNRTAVPAMNVKENTENFEVEIAAPGLKKEDFKIELDHGVLRISSKQKEQHEEKDENGNYTRREFSYQSFQRAFKLPEDVNAEQIGANYTDGVLKLILPKKEEAKEEAARLIEVN